MVFGVLAWRCQNWICSEGCRMVSGTVGSMAHFDGCMVGLEGGLAASDDEERWRRYCWYG